MTYSSTTRRLSASRDCLFGPSLLSVGSQSSFFGSVITYLALACVGPNARQREESNSRTTFRFNALMMPMRAIIVGPLRSMTSINAYIAACHSAVRYSGRSVGNREAGGLSRVGRFRVHRRSRLPDRRRGLSHFARGRLSFVAESRGRSCFRSGKGRLAPRIPVMPENCRPRRFCRLRSWI